MPYRQRERLVQKKVRGKWKLHRQCSRADIASNLAKKLNRIEEKNA